jgi:hypothetical protein
MRFKGISMLVAAGSLALAAGSAEAGTQIVDISAATSSGTIVSLAAGTYTIHFIGASQGGLYDGYSPWGDNAGCDGSGMNCASGFVENLAIDFGFGGTVFNHADGYQYGLLPVPGNNHIFSTGAAAIADIEASDIVRATLAQVNDPSAYAAIGGPISFTLAAGQSVNFFIYDYPYSDNRGGVSILLNDGLTANPAVPEPASWAMLIAGLGVVGASMRRRRAPVSFA